MPISSERLEQSLQRAHTIAGAGHHEYATLEHLLLALTDDADAAAGLRACNVDLEQLRQPEADICAAPETGGVLFDHVVGSGD
jgi:ATP-dependent Clp protease ATP-binding subunit ClpA